MWHFLGFFSRFLRSKHFPKRSTDYNTLISFIIPTFNYDCSALVAGLQAQAAAFAAETGGSFAYEILVGDDGSTDEAALAANRAVNSLPCCRCEERGVNVGRAYLRNWLIDAARYDHIVMLDADAALCTPDFVARYWQARDAADVVYGSLRNPAGPCPRGCELRYRCEHHAERWRKAHQGGNSPYLWLSTFNMMLNRPRLGGLRFDARCKEYGYEDMLFGLTLYQRGLTVKHIDNPLIHTGIDTNVSYLKKTETAMRTLHGLEGLMQEYAGTSRLYNSFRLFRLDGLFRCGFRLLRPLVRRNLLGHHPSVNLFQLYKVGYYALYDKAQRDKETTKQ